MNDARSALVILVPEAEPLVAAYRQRYDLSAAQGMPAHITLLFPFLPPAAIGDAILAQLQALFAAFPAFPHTLSAARLPRPALPSPGAGGPLPGADRRPGCPLPADPALRRQHPPR